MIQKAVKLFHIMKTPAVLGKEVEMEIAIFCAWYLRQLYISALCTYSRELHYFGLSGLKLTGKHIVIDLNT